MWQILPIHSWSAVVTRHWWIAGAFFNPIGITIHLKSPKGVKTAVSGISDASIHVWKKLFVISIVTQILPLVQSFKMLLIWGKGCKSAMVFLLS